VGTTDDIIEFPLGKQDMPDRLVIPEKLYGRQSQINALLGAFDRVVAIGRPELVLVSGYSGISKSSVVNELHKPLVPPRGLFASGKFDQYKRGIPYATLAQAFQSLIQRLLGKREAELAPWREVLREALGPNGQLMIDLVPELELIIGAQPPVPDLPPQDARRRFQLVFRRFISVFAQPSHPLALFFDDLQWLDAATLGLLEDLLTQSDVRHLMLIGAYRDNEVDSSHPLMRKLEAARSAGAVVHEIMLTPLDQEYVTQSVVDTVHTDPKHAAPLAQLVHEKTADNPFFCHSVSARARRGKSARVRSRYSAMVVESRSHSRQGVRRQRCRPHGRSIGTAARLRSDRGPTVGVPRKCCRSCHTILVYGTTETEIHSVLEEVLRADDRIQEPAYLLVPESMRAEAHLRIGRLLAAHTPLEKRAEAIFEIVNQLNRGAALITSWDEREQLAELNLIAAKRAKAASAYTAALTYLAIGGTALPEDAWERCYQLMFAIEINRAECEFLTGDLAAAEERLSSLSHGAANLVDKGAAACLRTAVYTTLYRSDHAVEICLEYLREAGIDWSPHPTDEEIRQRIRSPLAAAWQSSD
jgi:predicted ATPase